MSDISPRSRRRQERSARNWEEQLRVSEADFNGQSHTLFSMYARRLAMMFEFRHATDVDKLQMRAQTILHYPASVIDTEKLDQSMYFSAPRR